MNEELKKTIQAVLFASARKMSVSELAKICRRSDDEVLLALREWKDQLDSDKEPIILIEENDEWKLTVRENYITVVKKVVKKAELPKSILETLAVVAYKAPLLQSAVIRIRTNKAYDHLNYLENNGFVSREKKGRTKLIRLSPKFFEYFDIDPVQLKKKFTSMTDIERAIDEKEKEIEHIESSRKEEVKENLKTPQINIHSSGFSNENSVEIFMEKLGDLEVYDVPRSSRPRDDVKDTLPRTDKSSEDLINEEVKQKSKTLKSRKGKGLYVEGIPPDVEEKVDARVKEILEGEKE